MVSNAKFTTTQAAQYLGVTEAHIRRLCIKGRLKSEKVYLGNFCTWVIEKKELFDYDKGLGNVGRPRGPLKKKNILKKKKKTG